MSRRRMPMRQIRSILEYHFAGKVGAGQISKALGIAKGTVINTLHRFKQASLSWPLPTGLGDTELEVALFPVSLLEAKRTIEVPDIKWIEQELSKPHVTLQRLWEEYHEANPQGLGRSAFYRHWERSRPPALSMKVIHKGGDKLFLDYSGDGLGYVDASTGEVKPVSLFVAAWGASSYIFAHGTEGEKTEDWTQVTCRALVYYEVAPHALVPDNPKSVIVKPDRYEARINPLFEAMAKHYGAVVLPARVRHPKDKAVVENGVLQAQRYILAKLRNRQFFSLAEANTAIHEVLEELNDRPMKDYGGQTRRERFLALDRPYARPLPAEPFRLTSIKQDVRVAPNYHIRFDDHFYSVPYQLVRQCIDVHQCGAILELYHNGLHLCRHQKGPRNFQYTTIPEHMPDNHRFVRGWSEGYFLQKAEAIGPFTRQTIEKLLAKKVHVEQAFNTAMGLLRLAKAYSNDRLENACHRAVHFNTITVGSVRSILEHNLDTRPELPKTQPETTLLEDIIHENLRGQQYYLN